MESDEFRVIEADVLIPGRGLPVDDGALVYRDNRILYAGSRDGMPERYQNTLATRVPFLMPGM